MSDDEFERPWRHPGFAEGARDMAATAVGLAAWGLVCGVAMTNSGLGTGLAITMSLLVFAGSAQLAALPLISAGAPIWLVWATVACVNLRFIIFSAQWRPYLAQRPRWQRALMCYLSADLNFVRFMMRYPQPRPEPGQIAFFWGGTATNWLTWQASSITGIVLADRVPMNWGLGFAGTLALLAMVCMLINSRATALAALVAASASVAAFAMPYKLNIVVAIAAAVAVGAAIDQYSSLPAPSAGAGSR
jgi:predicted branched-subunit amino acid permease